MRSGTALARWYLRECLRVLDQLEEPQEWADARSLDAWLVKEGDCSTRHAQQYGPIRIKGRRDAALDILEELGRLALEDEGKRKQIRVNPALWGAATATTATAATYSKAWTSPVAGVATVAVASDPNGAFEV